MKKQIYFVFMILLGMWVMETQALCAKNASPDDLSLPTAFGDSLWVNSAADDGVGTLRWAIQNVNPDGYIFFNLPAGETINLLSQLIINKSLHIIGVPGLEISAYNNCRAFNIAAASEINVYMENLLIRNCRSFYGNGGGILCSTDALVELKNVEFFRCYAIFGGAIAMSDGFLHLSNVKITHNSAKNKGGGIFLENSAEVCFNPLSLSSIYNNHALYGSDMASSTYVVINANKISVQNPTSIHLFPVALFTCNSQAYMFQQFNELYVSEFGNDDNPGTSEAYPLRTIRQALYKMLDNNPGGSVIHLMDGVYGRSTNGEKFPLPGVDNLQITAETDHVILDGKYEKQLFLFENIYKFRLEGLKMQNANTAYSHGGAIQAVNSDIELIKVEISNSYGASGGAVSLINSDAVIKDCQLFLNESKYSGGAIYCTENSRLDLLSSTVTGNIAGDMGGGLFSNGSEGLLQLNVFSDNTADNGAGLFLQFDDGLILESNTIENNSANKNGGGLYVEKIKGCIHANFILNNPGQGQDYLALSPTIVF